MQEDIEQRSLTLIVSGTKLTGRLLKAAISKYLAHRKEKKLHKGRDSPDVQSYGKVSMDELKKQYGEMRELDVQDKSLRSFDRYARQYRVTYSVRTNGKGKYQVFFKAPNEANMQAAFEKYAGKKLQKAQRPSVLAKLEHFKALIKKPIADRAKKKEMEL